MMWDDLSQYIMAGIQKLSKSELEDSKAFQIGFRKMKISK